MNPSFLLVLFLTFYFASCEDCTLTVKRLLDNKNPLQEKDWTNVQVSCEEEGNVKLKLKCPHVNSNIKVYFANEVKNILVISLLGSEVRGYKYETPYGKVQELEGPDISEEDSTFEVDIPREWFPANVTRMSASVDVDGTIHCYYGIFNYFISIPDTLVVEEYKKLKCCLTDL